MLGLYVPVKSHTFLVEPFPETGPIKHMAGCEAMEGQKLNHALSPDDKIFFFNVCRKLSELSAHISTGTFSAREVKHYVPPSL